MTSRGTSKCLDRVLVDLGADGAFKNSSTKAKEHHGIDVSAGSIRNRCLEIAAEIAGMESPGSPVEKAKAIIAQMDGSMVQIVEPDPSQPDKRRNKKVFWREMRLSVAFLLGSATKFYGGGTISGGVAAAGEGLLKCVQRLGFGDETHVYGVSDGATWIADQFELLFGRKHSFTVDLFHACEHLAEAAPAFVASKDKARNWVSKQKYRLKKFGPEGVIKTLATRLEPEGMADADSPVRRCHRYFDNRPGQFDYPDAIANKRPVGSGAIEGGNKSVIQARLKKSGAFWLVRNAELMAALRICRFNDDWSQYWETKMAA